MACEWDGYPSEHASGVRRKGIVADRLQPWSDFRPEIEWGRGIAGRAEHRGL